MTPAEIRRALLHAAGAVGRQRPGLAVVLVAGVVAALGVGMFVAQRSGAGGADGPSITVVIGVLAAMAGVVMAVRRSR